MLSVAPGDMYGRTGSFGCWASTALRNATYVRAQRRGRRAGDFVFRGDLKPGQCATLARSAITAAGSIPGRMRQLTVAVAAPQPNDDRAVISARGHCRYVTYTLMTFDGDSLRGRFLSGCKGM